MDKIAAGETSKDEVLAVSREMLHSTTAALEDQREDFAKQIWAGMDEDKFLGPCKVCEEAGRKREDGSPEPAADHRPQGRQADVRLRGLEAATTPSAPGLLPGQRAAARPRLRALAARGALLGLRRAPAADGQGLPRPALEAVPQRRLPDDGRDAREARRAPGGQGGRARRRRPPPRRTATATAPVTAEEAADAAGAAKAEGRPAPDAQEAGAADGADQARALGQLTPAGVFITLEGIDRSGKTTQAALLAEALGPGTRAAARARRHARRRADPRAAQGPRARARPGRRAAALLRRPGGALPRGGRARRSTTATTSSATASSTRPSPTRASRAGSGVERGRAADASSSSATACRT